MNPGSPTVSEAQRPEPPPALLRVLHRRWRRGIQPLLFLLTVYTLTHAGWFFWSGSTSWDDSIAGWLWPADLARGIPYALAVLMILGAHEMGHYLACRRYRIPATLPFFLPGLPFLIPFGTFGAVIRLRGCITHRRALFDVAVAGPLAGFAVALPVLVWGMYRATPLIGDFEGERMVLGDSLILRLLSRAFAAPHAVEANAFLAAGWFGMLVTSLNLFPVGQLDGGHALYALSRRAHGPTARLCVMATLAFVVLDSTLRNTVSPYTLWCVILLVLRDRHPRLLDETSSLGAGRLTLAVLLLVVFLLTFVPIPMSP